MSDNIFGTDGIRKPFGQEPFTIPSLFLLGQAIAQWAQTHYRPNPSILLAHDTRLSCAVVKSALKSGLLLYPLELVDAQVLPSPAVGTLLQKTQKFDCGIIISASHNPYQDNGIKIIDPLNGKLSIIDEQQISSYFLKKISGTDYTSLGIENSVNFETEYCASIKKYFPFDFLKNRKIVLDCAHGATYALAPQIFKSFGAEVITLFDKPNGLNINKQCGSLYPETLQKVVVEKKADMGFAFDGDGDRVIAVNRFGQIKNGDDILTLLLAHPLYNDTDSVVGTIMTNQGFEVFLQQSQRTLIRTPVGDRHVAQVLKTKNLLLGGEASGHIIVRDYLPSGDGIFTALRTVEAIALSNNWDMQTFKKFPQIHTTIPVNNKKDLNQSPFSEIIAASTKQLQQGRLVIRYSGTEPILRIMVEDDDCDHAQFICSTLSKQLQKQLN